MASDLSVTKTISDSPFQLGPYSFTSRLIVGSGRYQTGEEMAECLELSGAECITVAVRRERLYDSKGHNILDFIDLDRYCLLPNTADCDCTRPNSSDRSKIY